MAVLALTNAFVLIDDYDFTGDSNSLMFNADAATLDATVFNVGGWKSAAGGLKSAKLGVDGFWQSAAANAVDLELFNDLGNGNRVATFGPVAGAGNVAYLGRLGKYSTQLFGKVGELAPFSLSCEGTDTQGFARGQIVAASTVVSATGAFGSGLQLGAALSTQKIWCSVHVLSAGTTITMVLESATANTFVGATTRATIGPLTTTGGVWLTPVAGPVTDTWWRLRCTAVTGSFTLTAAAAIQ